MDDTDIDILQAAIKALGQLGCDQQAVAPLLARLDDADADVRRAVIGALGQLGDQQLLEPLLDHSSAEVRQAAVAGLAELLDNGIDKKLLSRDLDVLPPWLDPREPITERRIADAAQRLHITSQEVRSRYEALAADFHLKFA